MHELPTSIITSWDRLRYKITQITANIKIWSNFNFKLTRDHAFHNSKFCITDNAELEVELWSLITMRLRPTNVAISGLLFRAACTVHYTVLVTILYCMC